MIIAVIALAVWGVFALLIIASQEAARKETEGQRNLLAEMYVSGVDCDAQVEYRQNRARAVTERN